MINYKELFEQLLNIKLNNSPQQKMLCPFHKDRNPSLSINIKEGIYNCFACGEHGNIHQLAKKFGYYIDDYGTLQPIENNSPKPKRKKSISDYTVSDYAQEKGLNPEFLQTEFKLEDYPEKHCIRIPYYDVDGSLIYYRYRAKNKRIWQDKNTKVMPYGLWKLKDIPPNSTLWIVEGESDTQTLWQNG